jgi:hypothetical protein
MGILEVVQIVFIILKLCKVINWRWKVVLIPLWISIGVTAIYLVLSIIGAILGIGLGWVG